MSRITNFWVRQEGFYFTLEGGALYFEDETTKIVAQLVTEPEGHRLLTILPNHRGLFVEDNDRIIVLDLTNAEEVASLGSLPKGVKVTMCVANEHFCVLAHKNSCQSPTDTYLWESTSLEELYHCYTTQLSISALALQENLLFIGTQGGDLYSQRLDKARPQITLAQPDYCYNYGIKLLMPVEDSVLVKTSRGVFRYSIIYKKPIDIVHYIERVFSPFKAPIHYSNGVLILLKKGSVTTYTFSPSTGNFLLKFMEKLDKFKSIEAYLAFLSWLFLLPQKSQDFLYLYVAKLHGKEEDLDYGRKAFHNEESHSATHTERMEALRVCFEKNCSPESDNGLAPVHHSDCAHRCTDQLSDHLQA